MRSPLLTVIAVSAWFLALVPPTQAAPLQGSKITIGGRANVHPRAAGPVLLLGGSVVAMVPFDYKSNFPGLYQLDGRLVEITGVANLGGMITLTDRDQLKVVG